MARPLDPAKRQRLLEAALRVFSREGYRRASVATICREAGIAKGGLYSYFGGKEELFGEVFLAMFAADLEMLREAVEAGRDPERTLRRLFGRWAAPPSGMEALVAVFLDFLAECGRGRIAPAVRDRAADLYLESRRSIAALLRSGVRCGTLRRGLDAEATAQAVIAFWDGLMAARLIVGQAIDVRRASSTFLRELLRGIRA